MNQVSRTLAINGLSLAGSCSLTPLWNAQFSCRFPSGNPPAQRYAGYGDALMKSWLPVISESIQALLTTRTGQD